MFGIESLNLDLMCVSLSLISLERVSRNGYYMRMFDIRKKEESFTYTLKTNDMYSTCIL